MIEYQEIDEITKIKIKKEIQKNKEFVKSDDLDVYEVLESDSWIEGATTLGNYFSKDELIDADSLLNENPLWKQVPSSMKAYLIREYEKKYEKKKG